MNRSYTPDNTRSSMAIVLSLAIAVGVIAVLVGLSDKPDVERLAVIGLSTDDTSAKGSAAARDFGFSAGDVSDDDAMLDEAGDPILDDQSLAQAQAVDAIQIPFDGAADAAPTTLQAPTSAPQPTPEVAAAVQPTAVPSVIPTPDPTAIPLASADSSGPTLSSGTVEGAFFVGGPQNEGATVAQNRIVVSFNTDGSGTFTGVLDITYVDGSRVFLDMKGDLVWTTSNPQVEVVVTGTYGFDAAVEADDVSADQGDLSITSLQSGSGSLCAVQCFGFTFPPQL